MNQYVPQELQEALKGLYFAVNMTFMHRKSLNKKIKKMKFMKFMKVWNFSHKNIQHHFYTTYMVHL